MTIRIFLLLPLIGVLFSGCTATSQQEKIQDVQFCGEGDCDTTGHTYSTGQLLRGFQRLLQTNENEQVTIYEADPETHDGDSVGVCQFVLGGFFPGPGCASSMVFSDIKPGEQANQLRMKVEMPLTYYGTPLFCKVADATLSVSSPREIALELQPRYCNWMVMGNMSATFNLAVNALDVQRGRIGGYWSHAVTGTGNGRGSGYLVLQFPKAMPKAENWLSREPPVHASRTVPRDAP